MEYRRGGRRRRDGETQVLVAVTALGVFVIFAIGFWLVILTSIEAEQKRKRDEERRRR